MEVPARRGKRVWAASRIRSRTASRACCCDDPTDLDTFGKLVLELLRDPERAAEMGARAREHVRRNFLANRHAAQYIDLFVSIIDARERRHAKTAAR